MRVPTKELYLHDADFGTCVLGVDEVGRGPLAGPVVCACVCLPLDGQDKMIEGVYDSKKVSCAQRERLSEQIKNTAFAYSVQVIDNTIIDTINILQATKLGMEKAIVDVVGQLKAKNHPLGTPAKALIDYVKLVVQGVETVSIVRGDAKSYHIAAASIVAKVHRDRLMQQVHTQYPHYGFLTNVGYGSKQHRQAIQDFGICPLHRHTFVKKILAEQKVGV